MICFSRDGKAIFFSSGWFSSRSEQSCLTWRFKKSSLYVLIGNLLWSMLKINTSVVHVPSLQSYISCVNVTAWLAFDTKFAFLFVSFLTGLLVLINWNGIWSQTPWSTGLFQMQEFQSINEDPWLWVSSFILFIVSGPWMGWCSVGMLSIGSCRSWNWPCPR